MMRAPRWAALLVVGMLPLGLAACGLGSSPRDVEAETATAVERAVGVAVPEANGVFVTTAFSGPRDRTLRVRLYLDAATAVGDAAALADAVDRAAASAWASTPIPIVQLMVEAAPGERPANPPRGVEERIDLAAAGEAWGIDARQVVDGRLLVSAARLTQRYGPAGGDVR